MSIFLDDGELGPAIIKLVKGNELRCAVAFWGNGAVRKLFKNCALPGSSKIICDLTMGGTNPEELRALGAPANERLKHLSGLHAKVYISDRGLIICSANVSNNGIGFLDVPKLIEAGVFHHPATDTYNAASRWFRKIWKAAKPVDDSALLHAKDAWARRLAGNHRQTAPRSPDPASLLDAVVADPLRFRGVGFVFSTGSSSAQQRDETAKAVAEKDAENPSPFLTERQRSALKEWPVGDVFSEWPPRDIHGWPERFVCAHRGARTNQLSYWFYERAHTAVLDGGRGMLLARRLPGLRRSLGFRTGAERMAEADKKKARHIFAHADKTGHKLFVNGEELERLLVTLAPWR